MVGVWFVFAYMWPELEVKWRKEMQDGIISKDGCRNIETYAFVCIYLWLLTHSEKVAEKAFTILEAWDTQREKITINLH